MSDQNDFLDKLSNMEADKLDKLFDKLTISYEKYLQNRQKLAEGSAQNILKTEEELVKKIAELQAEQEKMALEKKIKTEKDKDERIKLKTEAAQKEFDIQKDLLNKMFQIDKEALSRKIDIIKAANTGIIDQNELMQKLNEKYAADSLKLEQDLKQKKLQIVKEESEQIKKKYETTFSTIGKTITKIGTVLDGNLGKTVSNLGTAIEKIGTTIASGKKLTLTEALTSSVDFITNTVQVYKNGNKSVSGWDLINNTLNGAMLGSQIGSAIPVVGSTIGAVAGAGVDFASTIFGWIFGGGARKLQRELTTIGQISKSTLSENSNNKIVQKTYNNSIIGVNIVQYNDLYRHYQEQALRNIKFIEYINNPIKKIVATWFLVPNLQN